MMAATMTILTSTHCHSTTTTMLTKGGAQDADVSQAPGCFYFFLLFLFHLFISFEDTNNNILYSMY